MDAAHTEMHATLLGGPLRQDPGSDLALVVDELAHGVVIVTLDGVVAEANHAARDELARRSLPCEGARLANALRADEARALHESLLRAADGKRSLLSLSLGRGGPLSMAVVPLKTDGALPSKAALVFARPAVCEALMLCFFARSHGLTPTEEQVLAILCHGLSAPEIATRMNVAVSTIRSHVRSMCAKTRASGVRELVKRVSLLPPVAVALRQEPVH